jgi:hypothetical protein
VFCYLAADEHCYQIESTALQGYDVMALATNLCCTLVCHLVICADNLHMSCKKKYNIAHLASVQRHDAGEALGLLGRLQCMLQLLLLVLLAHGSALARWRQQQI